MNSLFEVYGTDKFKNNKKIIVSVYGVREINGLAEFLVYCNGWIWMDANYYTPINNKHS